MAERLSVLVVPSLDGPVGVAVGEGAVVAQVPQDCSEPRLLDAAGLSAASGEGDAVLLTVATPVGLRSFRLPRPLALLRRTVEDILPLPGFLRRAMTCRGAAGVLFLDDGTPALVMDAAELPAFQGEGGP